VGQLISIVGNSGVGKTTLTRQLCQRLPLHTGFEEHIERPFQQLFALDLPRYALPNQVDYLLFRAEQEWRLRQSAGIGIQDGGLDQDFHVFTRHFFKRGYLTGAEFQLCERLYALLRQCLPPPEAVVYLKAPLEVSAERLRRRNRMLEIASSADLAELQILLDEWLEHMDPAAIIPLDASADDASFSGSLSPLIVQLRTRLGAAAAEWEHAPPLAGGGEPEKPHDNE
jgi:deoxyadenosine/deoxycytidine kinase